MIEEEIKKMVAECVTKTLAPYLLAFGKSDEMITRSEFVKRYHVCPKTVYNWAERGIIPVHKIGSKKVLFKVSEIEEAMKSGLCGKYVHD